MAYIRLRKTALFVNALYRIALYLLSMKHLTPQLHTYVVQIQPCIYLFSLLKGLISVHSGFTWGKAQKDWRDVWGSGKAVINRETNRSRHDEGGGDLRVWVRQWLMIWWRYDTHTDTVTFSALVNWVRNVWFNIGVHKYNGVGGWGLGFGWGGSMKDDFSCINHFEGNITMGWLISLTKAIVDACWQFTCRYLLVLRHRKSC